MDLLFISETKIDSSFRDNIFEAQGYKFERRDRDISVAIIEFQKWLTLYNLQRIKYILSFDNLETRNVNYFKFCTLHHVYLFYLKMLDCSRLVSWKGHGCHLC